MKRKAAPKSKLATMDPCEAFVKLCSGSVVPPFDRKLVASVVGERIVKSLPEVAKAFGVGSSTPRKEWRPEMPGTSEKWNLVDITIWRLERAAKEAERLKKITGPGNERIKEIDLELAELNLRRREREENEASGRTIDVFLARAELSSFFTIMRDQLIAMPRVLYPLLPTKHVVLLSQHIEIEARRILVFVVESTQRALVKNTTEHYARILRQVDEIERDNDIGGSEPVD